MNKSRLLTMFASPERSSPEEITLQGERFRRSFFITPAMKKILNALQEMVIVVNRNRQIVFANRPFLDMLEIEDEAALNGLRPGEAMHCPHAEEGASGCGTSEHCRLCGSLLAILSGLTGHEEKKECRLRCGKQGDACDLAVSSTPLELEGERFIFCSLTDISHEKRRKSLERIFFHDVLNDISALHRCAELLPHLDEGLRQKFNENIYLLSRNLFDQVDAQRELLKAESKELSVNPSKTDTTQVLKGLLQMYGQDEQFGGYRIILDPASCSMKIATDSVLLSRVLSNMLKNALEASKPGEEVTIGCMQNEDHAQFYVHNISSMSAEEKLQVFQRSFSTKGKYRGLGTYSMKLLGEKYLGGRIHFTSTPAEGTTFFLEIPRELPIQQP